MRRTCKGYSIPGSEYLKDLYSGWGMSGPLLSLFLMMNWIMIQDWFWEQGLIDSQFFVSSLYSNHVALHSVSFLLNPHHTSLIRLKHSRETSFAFFLFGGGPCLGREYRHTSSFHSTFHIDFRHPKWSGIHSLLLQLE